MIIIVCMLNYTQSLIWPAAILHYSLNFGSEKIGQRTKKLIYIYYVLRNVLWQRQYDANVALFVLLN